MTESQLARLAKPFPPSLVNPPASGKYGSYVSHDVVTQKLLAVCGPYDFKVEQVVYSPDGIVEAVLATLTLTIDGVSRSVTETGDCEFPANKKTQGERLKDALSDSIKRCAMRFGVGLHLWSGSQYTLWDQLRARDESGVSAGSTGSVVEQSESDVEDAAGTPVLQARTK